MKKNRKQLNKEKKNLPREKERILDRNLFLKKEVSGDVSPLRIDGTGNITRLINKKGSVPPTETKMYKCEIEKSVPQFVRSLVDKIGLGEMIRVPIQEKGLTGSGKPKECHQNVLGIVKRFRGKVLRGYFVGKNGDVVVLLYHSVWITPEGKCKDITNNYDDRDSMDEDCIIRKGDKEYILFLPVGLGLIEELGVCVNSILFDSDWETNGVIIRTLSTEKFYPIPINLFDPFLKKYGLIGKGIIKTGRISIKWLKELVDCGGFSQKSLGSGKSWDELKTEIVW